MPAARRHEERLLALAGDLGADVAQVRGDLVEGDLAELPAVFFQNLPASIRRDKPTVTTLRSVLMKPEHAQWLDRIHEILISI